MASARVVLRTPDAILTPSGTSYLAWLGLALGVCACTGTIEPDSAHAPTSGLQPGGSDTVGNACSQIKPTPDSQFLQLSHPQYQNAVKDLLGIDVDVAGQFISD